MAENKFQVNWGDFIPTKWRKSIPIYNWFLGPTL